MPRQARRQVLPNQSAFQSNWTYAKTKRFVIVWQKAKSIEEVERLMGEDRKSLSGKAAHLRRKKVPLKTFTLRGQDMSELQKLAMETLPQEEVPFLATR